MMPDGPSNITSRTSMSVSPTRAMRPYFASFLVKGGKPRTSALTHSAPSRVLPAPRPPSTSHVSWGSGSGYCLKRPCPTHSAAMSGACSLLMFSSHHLICELTGKCDHAVIEALECGGHFFIGSVLLLLGALEEMRRLADLLHHAQHGRHRVDARLVVLAACPAALGADRLELAHEPVRQHGKPSFEHLRTFAGGIRTPAFPLRLCCYAPDGAPRDARQHVEGHRRTLVERTKSLAGATGFAAHPSSSHSFS